MGAQFLIDTNSVLELLGGKLPPAGAVWLDEVLTADAYALSVITRIELFSKAVGPAETATLQALVAASLVLPLDEAVIQQTIQVRQRYQRKLPDAVIAATALVHNLTLVTRNTSDFQAIAGLRVLNPHDVAALPTS